MTIGVDIDSVIAAIRAPLIDFHNKRYKTNLKPNDIRNYDLSIAWKCTHKEKLDRIFEFYRSPYMNEIRPIWGSRTGISNLSITHELVVITSRPTWISDITENWIETYFPGKFKQIVHTNQVSNKNERRKTKSDVCHELGAELIIEDHLEYARECADNGIRVLLYSMPWNSVELRHPNINRVHSWKNIVNLLGKLE